MSDDDDFILRTEDIKPDEVLGLFVPIERDRDLIQKLKSTTPTIIEGSRGTGKSLLLRVCEQEQLGEFEKNRILPIYVSFSRSSLLSSSDTRQFQHWMLARLCSRISRVLTQQGLSVQTTPSMRTLAGGEFEVLGKQSRLEEIADQFEDSYKAPGTRIDITGLPTIEKFKDAIEDICDTFKIKRINVLFDEAAHIFRPEQQRQFFTLFRDLRSPYMTCNAAVYPGVTSYGDSFESSHDAQIESLNRDITSRDYVSQMQDVVFRQAGSQLQDDILKHKNNFAALAYCVSGNPRLLLKTVALSGRLRTVDVERVIKEFFRDSIWSEHSGLAERYPGHKSLIDWGRTFIEQTVIKDTNDKNETWNREKKAERTCFFWVHRDAPEAAREALRLLMYTGIVSRLDVGVIATRRELGTRYSINIGCLAADARGTVVAYVTDLRRGLTVKRYTEYGSNYSEFTRIARTVGQLVEADLSKVLEKLLSQSVDVLELTGHQKAALHEIKVNTIGQALRSKESDFKKAWYIGPKRSRRIMNVVNAAIFEYLSG